MFAKFLLIELGKAKLQGATIKIRIKILIKKFKFDD